MKSNTSRLTLATYDVGILQSKAHRVLTSFMAEVLKKDGLSVPQWAVLGVVHDAVGQRPFQIAERLGVRPPVATVLVNELEEKQLVVRKVHATDSRATNIVLTRQGKQLVIKVEQRLQKQLQGFLKDVTLPELSVYMRVLTKIVAKA